jgi:hypothetical protein
MNQDDNIPLSTRTSAQRKKSGIGSYMAAAALLLIVLFLWRDQLKMKANMAEMAEQNDQLQLSLATAQSELNDFKTGAPAKRPPAATTRARPAPPAEEPESLLLQEPVVRQTTEGLIARFAFKPVGTEELPKQITLVVRVPANSSAKILSLVPVSTPSYSSVATVVNKEGKLGMVEGSPADLEALTYELTVSSPVKATVRGSKGIAPFEIDISPDSATVRRL